MRSLLLVRPHSDAALAAALAAGADAVTVDFTGSLTVAERDAHRRRTADYLRRRGAHGRFFVRVNALASGLTSDDLDAVVPARPHAIVLAGATGIAEVVRLSALLRPREAMAGIADGATAILAVAADTPAGVLALDSFAAGSRRLIGIAWDETALRSTLASRAPRRAPLPDPLRLARALTVVAAAAGGVAAIDTAVSAGSDLAALERDTRQARDDGFSAKFAADADQVAVINRVFAASNR